MRARQARRQRSARLRVRLARRSAARALAGRWRAALDDGLLGPVLTLVTGAVAAQAVGFGVRPVLTRLFSDEAFGVLTLFTTLAAVAGTFATAHYDDAIPLPERDADAAALLPLALGGAAIVALAASLAALARESLAVWAGEPALAPALVLLGPAILGLSAAQAVEAWHARRGRFRLISGVRLAQSGVVAGLQVAAGLGAAGAMGLVGPTALGFGAAALGLGAALVLRDRAPLRAVRAAAVRRAGRRYAPFARFTTPAAFLNVLGTRAPVFVLALAFGPGAVGQFGLAFGSLALPLGLVAGSVGQVFKVRSAEAHRAGALGPLTRGVLRGLLAVLLYPTLVVLAAGPDLFAWAFGPDWAEAGRHARAIASWVLLTSVAVPLTRVFDVTERQRADLAFSAVMFVGMGAVLLVAGRLASPLAAVTAAGAAGAALRLGHVAWMLQLAGVPLLAALGDALRLTAVALPFALLPGVAAALDAPGVVTFALAVAGGLAALPLSARLRTANTASVPGGP